MLCLGKGKKDEGKKKEPKKEQPKKEEKKKEAEPEAEDGGDGLARKISISFINDL